MTASPYPHLLAPLDLGLCTLPNRVLMGMKYINIPVNWGTPTRDGLNIFMDAMDANQDRKIHVHCEANFRASAFIAMYRILRLGWKEADAGLLGHGDAFWARFNAGQAEQVWFYGALVEAFARTRPRRSERSA